MIGECLQMAALIYGLAICNLQFAKKQRINNRFCMNSTLLMNKCGILIVIRRKNVHFLILLERKHSNI